MDIEDARLCLASAGSALVLGFIVMTLASPILDQRSGRPSVALVFSAAAIMRWEYVMGKQTDDSTAIRQVYAGKLRQLLPGKHVQDRLGQSG